MNEDELRELAGSLINQELSEKYRRELREVLEKPGVLPSVECLQPHELARLARGGSLTDERREHVSYCRYCLDILGPKWDSLNPRG